jgi:hypothetical protein
MRKYSPGLTFSVRSMFALPLGFHDLTRIFLTPGGTFHVAELRVGRVAASATPMNGRAASPASNHRLFIYSFLITLDDRASILADKCRIADTLICHIADECENSNNHKKDQKPHYCKCSTDNFHLAFPAGKLSVKVSHYVSHYFLSFSILTPRKNMPRPIAAATFVSVSIVFNLQKRDTLGIVSV